MKTHIFKLIFFSIFAGFILIFIAFSYTQNSIQSLKLSDLKNFPALKIGDLIFREGIGYDSLVVKKLSQSSLTHIGIVASLKPLLILHASADENKNKVELVSFDEFLSLSKDIAIKRFDLDEKILQSVVNLAKQNLDKDFVLSVNEDKLYCTTLLENAFKPFIKLDLEYQNIEFAMFSGAYLFPKAFFDDEKSKLIYRYKQE